MRYITETGIILSSSKEILQVVDGYSAHVESHSQLIWRIHKLNPGIIYGLMHTHPPFMTSLSGEDETTLRAQAMALAPFPARVATVAQIDEYLFKTSIYLGIYQSPEDYVYRKQIGKRRFEIILEKEHVFFHPNYVPRLPQQEFHDLIGSVRKGHMETWEKIIVERSYQPDQFAS